MRIDEEMDFPVECVNGNCPIALSEEYEEYGIPVTHSCEECYYNNKKMGDR